MPERILLARVKDLARLRGFWVFHDADSRRNVAGLPDLLLIRPPRLLWVELKREDGKLRPEQELVIAMLRESGQDVRVWKPSSWSEIEETLGGVG